MTEPQQLVTRMLAAIEATPEGLAALETMILLAVRLRAQLHGLFVEDENLLRLARFTFAREVTPSSAALRPLDTAAMERALRAQAERIRRNLALAADRAQVPWQFTVARGQVLSQVLAAAAQSDVLVLSEDAGTLAREALRQAPGTVVVLRHDLALDRPVVVLYDGTPSSERALATAAQLAQEDHNNLIVLLYADDEARERQLRLAAGARLDALGLAARYRRIHSRRAGVPEALLDAVHAAVGHALVIGAQSPLLTLVPPDALLDILACPLVLVR